MQITGTSPSYKGGLKYQKGKLDLGEGPIKSGPNVPGLRVPSVPHHARWLILGHCMCVLSTANFTLGS